LLTTTFRKCEYADDLEIMHISGIRRKPDIWPDPVSGFQFFPDIRYLVIRQICYLSPGAVPAQNEGWTKRKKLKPMVIISVVKWHTKCSIYNTVITRKEGRLADSERVCACALWKDAEKRIHNVR